MKNKKFLLVFIICIVVLFFKAHTIIADQWDENDCNAGKDYGWVYPPFVEDPSNIAHYIYDHNTKGRQQTGTISFCYKKNAACPSSTHECRNYTSENGNLQGFCNGSAPGFFWCNSGVCCKASDKILDKSEKLYFDPEVGIPGFRKQQKIDGDLMGKFAKQLYIYLLGLSGIVAVLVLILAGFQWVMAGGNQNKIGEAKQRIINAITGLVLLSCSYLILYTINPKLVEIKTIEVNTINPEKVDESGHTVFDCSSDRGIQCHDCYGGDSSKCPCDSSGGTILYRLPDSKDVSGNFINEVYCCKCNACETGDFPSSDGNCEVTCQELGYRRNTRIYSSGNKVCCECSGTATIEDDLCSGVDDYTSCIRRNTNGEITFYGYCYSGLCMQCKNSGESCESKYECMERVKKDGEIKSIGCGKSFNQNAGCRKANKVCRDPDVDF